MTGTARPPAGNGEGVWIIPLRISSLSDVLVPTTAPPWTPLFATAVAVVSDTGGILSHGAVVAREYGIPAVVGTGDGTMRIQDGQLIAVDGDAGSVRLL